MSDTLDFRTIETKAKEWPLNMIEAWGFHIDHAVQSAIMVKNMKIGPGESVIIVLHTPREKYLAIVDEISPAGVFARTIDLGYFDDWCRSITEGEPYLPMDATFLPMWRIERITLDASSQGHPSMAEQFEKRIGKSLGEF